MAGLSHHTFDDEGLTCSWREAARWNRRASRELGCRGTVGCIAAAMLDDLRAVDLPEDLRRAYIERDGEWANGIADQVGLGTKRCPDLRRARMLLPTDGVGLRSAERLALT